MCWFIVLWEVFFGQPCVPHQHSFQGCTKGASHTCPVASTSLWYKSTSISLYKMLVTVRSLYPCVPVYIAVCSVHTRAYVRTPGDAQCTITVYTRLPFGYESAITIYEGITLRERCAGEGETRKKRSYSFLLLLPFTSICESLH